MSNPTAKISMVCMKTVSGERLEYGGVVKKTSHPGFEIKVEFDEFKKKKKSFTCPHCGKEVGYKAFRWEFNLRRALKWPAIAIGLGVVLFFACVFLGMGGLSIDQVGWLAIWGFILFALGLGWLLIQSMRYLSLYRKDKHRYIFSLSGLSSNHILLNWTRGGSWRALSPTLP